MLGIWKSCYGPDRIEMFWNCKLPGVLREDRIIFVQSSKISLLYELKFVSIKQPFVTQL